MLRAIPFICLFLTTCSSVFADESKIMEGFKKHKPTIERDTKSLDKPIVAVEFKNSTEAIPVEVLESLKGLSKLKRVFIFVRAEHLETLAKLEQIETLSVNITPFDPASLKHLAKLKNLKSLVILNNQMTDEGIKSLDKLTDLEILELQGFFTGVGLKELVGLKKLKELHLRSPQIVDEHAKALGQFTSLEKLSLNQNKLTHAILPELAKLDKLKELAINETAIPHGDLEKLERIKTLKKISFETQKITDAVLIGLGKANLIHTLEQATNEKNLPAESPLDVHTLAMFQSKVSFASASALAGLKNLRLYQVPLDSVSDNLLLELDKIGLLYALMNFTTDTKVRPKSLADVTRVNLVRTYIRGGALQVLAKAEKLQVLNLFEVNPKEPISRLDLKQLPKLPKLETLQLSPKDVNDANVKIVVEQGLLQALELHESRTPLTPVAKTLEDRKSLSLMQVTLTPYLQEQFAAFKNVEKLSFNPTGMTEKELKAMLDAYPKLSELDVGISTLPTKIYPLLAGCKELTEIRLEKAPLTEEGCKVLAELPKLKRVTISNTKPTEAMLQLLAESKSIKFIRAVNVPISNKLIKELQNKGITVSKG